MASETEINKEVISTLKDVINTLQDGQKGFADLGQHLKDETLKRYFDAESLHRASFRGDLESELHRHGVKDIHEEGTTAGTLHRTWGDLLGKIGIGNDDHALLNTAEQGEDAAKKAYAEALNHQLPGDIRNILETQQRHILSSHDYVKAARDARGGK